MPQDNKQGRSHAAMAHQMFDELLAKDKQAPLGDAGALYRYDQRSGLWLRYELDALAGLIGDAIDEQNCKRVSDYRGISSLVYSQSRKDIAHDCSPFDKAPPGIAAEGKFYKMNGEGVESMKLAPEHLARFAVPVAPNAKHPRPLFDGLIAASFPITDKDYEQQRQLLQMHFGACIVNSAPRMQKAMLWQGVERSGKSTLQEIMRSMFMAQNVAAVPPHLWQHEYHVAALANRVLNTVGEVDDHRPLNVSFKNVIGMDLLHGRHVTHRPFSFKNQAGHVFACNGFPPSEDQSNAFWERWSIIQFRHIRLEQQRDDHLAEKIIGTELPGVLAWALEGARLLAVAGGKFPKTDAHAALMEKWRSRTDSVRSWLADDLDPDAVFKTCRNEIKKKEKETWLNTQTDLHAAYCRWCAKARRHPLGLHTFGDALRNAFPLYGLKEDSETHKIFGIRLPF